ncbi:Uncharacterised protein [Porphyromonas cangingivalis]|nr:Uncharacterised protein [Porphyromonas cangingivalis]
MGEITIKDYFSNLLQEVDSEIQTIELNESDFLHVCKKVINYLQDIISDLKSFVLNYKFQDNSEEILFFKHLKPQISSKLIYYKRQFDVRRRRMKQTHKPH